MEAVASATSRIADGAAAYHNACMREIAGLKMRFVTIRKHAKTHPPQGTDPGFSITQRCITKFIGNTQSDRTAKRTVRTRAVRAMEAVPGAPKSPLMELIIVQGAIKHYDSVIAAMARFGVSKAAASGVA